MSSRTLSAENRPNKQPNLGARLERFQSLLVVQIRKARSRRSEEELEPAESRTEGSRNDSTTPRLYSLRLQPQTSPELKSGLNDASYIETEEKETGIQSSQGCSLKDENLSRILLGDGTESRTFLPQHGEPPRRAAGSGDIPKTFRQEVEMSKLLSQSPRKRKAQDTLSAQGNDYTTDSPQKIFIVALAEHADDEETRGSPRCQETLGSVEDVLDASQVRSQLSETEESEALMPPGGSDADGGLLSQQPAWEVATRNSQCCLDDEAQEDNFRPEVNADLDESTIYRSRGKPAIDAALDECTIYRSRGKPAIDAALDESTIYRSRGKPAIDAALDESTIYRSRGKPAIDATLDESTIYRSRGKPAIDAALDECTVVFSSRKQEANSEVDQFTARHSTETPEISAELDEPDICHSDEKPRTNGEVDTELDESTICPSGEKKPIGTGEGSASKTSKNKKFQSFQSNVKSIGNLNEWRFTTEESVPTNPSGGTECCCLTRNEMLANTNVAEDIITVDTERGCEAALETEEEDQVLKANEESAIMKVNEETQRKNQNEDCQTMSIDEYDQNKKIEEDKENTNTNEAHSMSLNEEYDYECDFIHRLLLPARRPKNQAQLSLLEELQLAEQEKQEDDLQLAEQQHQEDLQLAEQPQREEEGIRQAEDNELSTLLPHGEPVFHGQEDANVAPTKHLVNGSVDPERLVDVPAQNIVLNLEEPSSMQPQNGASRKQGDDRVTEGYFSDPEHVEAETLVQPCEVFFDAKSTEDELHDIGGLQAGVTEAREAEFSHYLKNFISVDDEMLPTQPFEVFFDAVSSNTELGDGNVQQAQSLTTKEAASWNVVRQIPPEYDSDLSDYEDYCSATEEQNPEDCFNATGRPNMFMDSESVVVPEVVEDKTASKRRHPISKEWKIQLSAAEGIEAPDVCARGLQPSSTVCEPQSDCFHFYHALRQSSSDTCLYVCVDEVVTMEITTGTAENYGNRTVETRMDVSENCPNPSMETTANVGESSAHVSEFEPHDFLSSTTRDQFGCTDSMEYEGSPGPLLFDSDVLSDGETQLTFTPPHGDLRADESLLAGSSLQVETSSSNSSADSFGYKMGSEPLQSEEQALRCLLTLNNNSLPSLGKARRLPGSQPCGYYCDPNDDGDYLLEYSYTRRRNSSAPDTQSRGRLPQISPRSKSFLYDGGRDRYQRTARTEKQKRLPSDTGSVTTIARVRTVGNHPQDCKCLEYDCLRRRGEMLHDHVMKNLHVLRQFAADSPRKHRSSFSIKIKEAVGSKAKDMIEKQKSSLRSSARRPSPIRTFPRSFSTPSQTSATRLRAPSTSVPRSREELYSPPRQSRFLSGGDFSSSGKQSRVKLSREGAASPRSRVQAASAARSGTVSPAGAKCLLHGRSVPPGISEAWRNRPYTLRSRTFSDTQCAASVAGAHGQQPASASTEAIHRDPWSAPHHYDDLITTMKSCVYRDPSLARSDRLVTDALDRLCTLRHTDEECDRLISRLKEDRNQNVTSARSDTGRRRRAGASERQQPGGSSASNSPRKSRGRQTICEDTLMPPLGKPSTAYFLSVEVPESKPCRKSALMVKLDPRREADSRALSSETKRMVTKSGRNTVVREVEERQYHPVSHETASYFYSLSQEREGEEARSGEGSDAPRVDDVGVPRIDDVRSPQGDDVGTPRVHDVGSPPRDDIGTPQVYGVGSQQGDDVDAPRVDDDNAPRVDGVCAPQVDDIGAPRADEFGVPRVDDVGAPQVNDVGIARVDDVGTPRGDDPDPPRAEGGQAYNITLSPSRGVAENDVRPRTDGPDSNPLSFSTSQTQTSPSSNRVAVAVQTSPRLSSDSEANTGNNLSMAKRRHPDGTYERVCTGSSSKSSSAASQPPAGLTRSVRDEQDALRPARPGSRTPPPASSAGNKSGSAAFHCRSPIVQRSRGGIKPSPVGVNTAVSVTHADDAALASISRGWAGRPRAADDNVYGERYASPPKSSRTSTRRANCTSKSASRAISPAASIASRMSGGFCHTSGVDPVSTRSSPNSKASSTLSSPGRKSRRSPLSSRDRSFRSSPPPSPGTRSRSTYLASSGAISHYYPLHSPGDNSRNSRLSSPGQKSYRSHHPVVGKVRDRSPPSGPCRSPCASEHRAYFDKTSTPPTSPTVVVSMTMSPTPSSVGSRSLGSAAGRSPLHELRSRELMARESAHSASAGSRPYGRSRGSSPARGRRKKSPDSRSPVRRSFSPSPKKSGTPSPAASRESSRSTVGRKMPSPPAPSPRRQLFSGSPRTRRSKSPGQGRRVMYSTTSSANDSAPGTCTCTGSSTGIPTFSSGGEMSSAVPAPTVSQGSVASSHSSSRPRSGATVPFQSPSSSVDGSTPTTSLLSPLTRQKEYLFPSVDNPSISGTLRADQSPLISGVGDVSPMSALSWLLWPMRVIRNFLFHSGNNSRTTAERSTCSPTGGPYNSTSAASLAVQVSSALTSYPTMDSVTSKSSPSASPNASPTDLTSQSFRQAAPKVGVSTSRTSPAKASRTSSRQLSPRSSFHSACLGEAPVPAQFSASGTSSAKASRTSSRQASPVSSYHSSCLGKPANSSHVCTGKVSFTKASRTSSKQASPVSSYHSSLLAEAGNSSRVCTCKASSTKTSKKSSRRASPRSSNHASCCGGQASTRKAAPVSQKSSPKGPRTSSKQGSPWSPYHAKCVPAQPPASRSSSKGSRSSSRQASPVSSVYSVIVGGSYRGSRLPRWVNAWGEALVGVALVVKAILLVLEPHSRALTKAATLTALVAVVTGGYLCGYHCCLGALSLRSSINLDRLVEDVMRHLSLRHVALPPL